MEQLNNGRHPQHRAHSYSKTKQAEKIKKFATKKAELDVTKLAKDLEIDIEIFEQNQAKLGQSILNAAEQRKFAMSEIARGRVQADIQADAARMLPPRFAPDPPRPYKAEMPTLVPPPEPDAITREMYQVPQPEKPSGISSALGGIGMVAGIIGTVATAGAAIPAVAAAVPSLSTIGTVAGGVSKASSMLSSYTRY